MHTTTWRGGEVMISVAWMVLGENFGQPSMKYILIGGFPMTVNYIWDYVSKGILSVVDPH